MSLFVEMKNESNWKFLKTLKASSIDSLARIITQAVHKKYLKTHALEKNHTSVHGSR